MGLADNHNRKIRVGFSFLPYLRLVEEKPCANIPFGWAIFWMILIVHRQINIL